MTTTYDTDEQMDEQALIISTVDTVVPPDRDYWLDDEMFPVDDRTGMYYPNFAVQDVAKVFFGREADWLRWRMRASYPNKTTGEVKHPDGFFLLGGKPMDFKRKPVVTVEWRHRKSGNRVGEKALEGLDDKARRERYDRVVVVDHEPESETARYFTLADIERMAHALAQQGVIDGLRLSHIVVMVRACARLWGVAV